jgi:hypothetical protein
MAGERRRLQRIALGRLKTMHKEITIGVQAYDCLFAGTPYRNHAHLAGEIAAGRARPLVSLPGILGVGAANQNAFISRGPLWGVALGAVVNAYFAAANGRFFMILLLLPVLWVVGYLPPRPLRSAAVICGIILCSPARSLPPWGWGAVYALGIVIAWRYVWMAAARPMVRRALMRDEALFCRVFTLAQAAVLERRTYSVYHFDPAQYGEQLEMRQRLGVLARAMGFADVPAMVFGLEQIEDKGLLALPPTVLAAALAQNLGWADFDAMYFAYAQQSGKAANG